MLRIRSNASCLYCDTIAFCHFDYELVIWYNRMRVISWFWRKMHNWVLFFEETAVLRKIDRDFVISGYWNVDQSKRLVQHWDWGMDYSEWIEEILEKELRNLTMIWLSAPSVVFRIPRSDRMFAHHRWVESELTFDWVRSYPRSLPLAAKYPFLLSVFSFVLDNTSNRESILRCPIQ